MNRSQVIDTISNKLEIQRKDVVAVLEAFDSVAVETLKKGEAFSLGRLGKLDSVKRAARVGLNPSNGQKINIPEKQTAKFKPSKDLLAQIA